MNLEAIEAQFADLKEAYANNEIDAEAFQSAVDELRIQDNFGRYWMIGAESGSWFYFDGVSWTEADPKEADSLPFIDDNGVYWMLGQDSNEWYYYDGDNWIQAEANGTDMSPPAGPAQPQSDEGDYYQDEEGRYWTVGKKSGEWYYYDETGWHKASVAQPAPATNGMEAKQYFTRDGSQPVSTPPDSHTVPFQPVQPAPAYLQDQPPINQPSTHPVAPQPPYQTASYSTQVPVTDPLAYTQPITPQGAAEQGVAAPQAQQPVMPYAYTQPITPQPQPMPTVSYNQAVPSMPQPSPINQGPIETAEPGVWMYFDGEQWIKYRDDEGVGNDYLGETNEDYLDDEAYIDEVELLDEEKVIAIEDLDEFVEVVEVAEEDIIDTQADTDTVDVEFQVEVLKPDETPKTQTAPAEAVGTTATVDAATSDIATTTKATPLLPTQPQASRMPRVAGTPHQPDFDAKTVPVWFWTSLTGLIILFVVALLLIGTLQTLNNRQQAAIVVVAQETPTLPSSAPLSTPTEAPTPIPTPTMPPTATLVPLANYNSDYFGFSFQYPQGWLVKEDDNLVIFAPSTRSLDADNLAGAAIWISFTDSHDITQLFANGLERFAPIVNTLQEGAMTIGNESWLSAQIQFEAESLGQEAIALVASTVREDLGYTLAVVAPASEWEDFIHLFQYPVNSFAFVPRQQEQLIAQAETPQVPDDSNIVAENIPNDSPESKSDEASVDGDNGQSGELNTSEDSLPTPTIEIEATASPEAAITPTEVAATATATIEPTETPVPEPTVITHEIVSGDTLGGIAVQYDVSINDLLQANNLTRDVILSLGRELLIPIGGLPAADTAETEEPEDEPVAVIHEIISGDTLGGIAVQYDVSIDAILQANSLDRDVILQLGQELIIPLSEDEIDSSTLANNAVRPTPAPPREPTPTPVPQITLSGRIVYPAYSQGIRSFDIWSANIDGSNPVLLVGNASQPAFTRDGRLFAYRSWEPSGRGVAFIDFVGGRQGLLTSFIEDGLPTWSRDGTLVISSRRESDRAPRLYRVRQDQVDTNLQFNGEYPDTLADGRLVSRGCSVTGDCGLWTLPAGGGGATKISNDTSDTAPAAHPASDRIALMSFDRGGANNWEIWTINANGANPQRLTENGANDGLPTWSPDGQSIAFVSDRGGVWAVWAMNSDGSNQRKLFNMIGPPDGVIGHDENNSTGWLGERIFWLP